MDLNSLVQMLFKNPIGPPIPSAPPAISQYTKQAGPYQTKLSPTMENQFQSWVTQNKIPFDNSATADYDMRGFYQALQNKDPRALTAINKFDNRIHFPDTWKTPYHNSFSNESIYANKNAPRWQGDRLVDNRGRILVDETGTQ